MFDVDVINKRLVDKKTVEIFGKSYEVKNCVKIVNPDIIKLCMVLVSDTSELSVALDIREYQLDSLLGVKHV